MDEYQVQGLQLEVQTIKNELQRIKGGSSYSTLSVIVPDTSASTAANYGVFFIAPYSCEVIEAWASWKTAGGSNPTLTVEKLTGGVALDSGSVVLESTWDMAGTANDPIRKRCVSNISTRRLNPGDRLALKDAGTLTSVAHVCVTVLIRALNFNLSRVDNP